MLSKSANVLDHCQVLVFGHELALSADLSQFLAFAQSLALPITYSDTKMVDQTLLNKFAEDMNRSQQSMQRVVILLCGAHLEEQVSFAAHYLLQAGFDVRLVRDLISTRNSGHAQFHDQRLAHAGAMPTTTKQLVYEWAATEQNNEIRLNLIQFLDALQS